MAEANWYVVHTYSGYENKVKVDIEKTLENRKLQDEILEVRVPLEDVVGDEKRCEETSFKKNVPRLCSDPYDHERRHMVCGS